MTLSYNIGLTAGSLVAYLLDAILGEKNSNYCEDSVKLMNNSIGNNFSTNIFAMGFTTSTVMASMSVPSTITAEASAERLNTSTSFLLNATLPTLFNTTINSSFV